MNKKYKFLIREDNKISFEKLSTQLSSIFDCEIHKVTNDEETLASLEKNTYNLFIADIHVPILSRLNFIAKLRKKNKNIPIIITSACTQHTFTEQIKKLKIDYFMIKPVFIKEISKNIQNLIF